MPTKTQIGVLCIFIIAVSTLGAEESKTEDRVSLSIKADREQPVGWPIIVELTVTNIGKEPIIWWCGGPDLYPGIRYFVVEVRYEAKAGWHQVFSASNGQYRIGSGLNRGLGPGKSIVVPIAVPIELPGSVDSCAKRDNFVGCVSVRVSPRSWHAETAAMVNVEVVDKRTCLDRRRTMAINAVLNCCTGIWKHVAQRYPDSVVLDAMLKLIAVDCVPIASAAASILARQPRLPEEAGSELALMVRRWVKQSSGPKWWCGLVEDLVAAALKTQSESTQKTVLELLQQMQYVPIRGMIIRVMSRSPGDLKWLKRARAAILNLQRASPKNKELAEHVKPAVRWLDQRLKK
jgi:hypothetical protein